MTTCSRTDCQADATACPEILVWSVATPLHLRTPENALQMRIRLPICQAHAAASTPADFMTEASWQTLERQVSEMGYTALHRPSARVRWVHLLPGDVE